MREPAGEGGGEGVSGEARFEVAQEGSPFSHRGLAVASQTAVEVALPAGRGFRELAFAGGAQVGVGDADRGAPDGEPCASEFIDQGPVLIPLIWAG